MQLLVAVSLLFSGWASAQDLPGVRFSTRDIGACDPAATVFGDPRSSAWADFLRQVKLYDEVKRLFGVRGGTVIVPTRLAIETFLESNEFESAAEAFNMTGGSQTWAPIISAHFLANGTNPPKDVATPTTFSSPYGTATLPVGVFGPTPRYRLYTYVQVIAVDSDNYQVQAGFLRFTTPTSQGGDGQQGQGRTGVVQLSDAANFTDWTIACDQYVVYYTDNMMLPFSDPDDLARYGVFAARGVASIVDIDTGRVAANPPQRANNDSMSSSSSSGGGNGKRRMLLEGAWDSSQTFPAVDWDKPAPSVLL